VGTIDDLSRRQPQMWLSLLRELTAATPDWFTMKGVESALTGVGDVDSIAPVRTWPLVVDTFHRWASVEDLGPVVVCRHAPYLLHLVAMSALRPEVFELDVNSRKIFFGSTLFRPHDVSSMTLTDARGFRRLRPGAEGVLKLIQNGSTRDGRPRVADLNAKGIVELIASDPEGARLFADRFGIGASAVVRACDAVVAGSWDRNAVLRAKAACLVRAVREPDAIAARLRFRWQRSHCPVLHTLLTGKRRVESPEIWLREVALTHEVRR
jgi:hypothetical protein